MSSSSGRRSTLAQALASHLIDARGTVEPNVDPAGVESRLRDGVFLWLDIDSPTRGGVTESQAAMRNLQIFLRTNENP